MWKSKFIQFAIKLNSSLNEIGVGDLRFVRDLKRRSKKLMLRLLAPDNLILIEAHGLPMYIYANTIDTGVYLLAPFEPYTTELFKQAIKPGSKILDIGAQFGYFSLIAAKQAGQEGRVYAFEPAPANFQLLNRNIQMNGYTDIILAVQKGVGNRHTKEPLYLYEGCDSPGMHCHTQRSLKETISIECVTIDEFLGGSPVDVVKMDIEGNEPYALEGMKQTVLKNHNIIMFIEVNPILLSRAGVKPEDFLGQLESLGFDVQLIDEHSRCLKPISKELLKKVDPEWYANIYCLKER